MTPCAHKEAMEIKTENAVKKHEEELWPSSPIKKHAVKKEESDEEDERTKQLLRRGEPQGSTSQRVKNEEEEEEEKDPVQRGYEMRKMKWNMPSWAGQGEWAYSTARAESVNDKPPTPEWNWFKGKGRCVVVCDG